MKSHEKPWKTMENQETHEKPWKAHEKPMENQCTTCKNGISKLNPSEESLGGNSFHEDPPM